MLITAKEFAEKIISEHVTDDSGEKMGKAAIATIIGYVSLSAAAIGWILH